MSVMCVGDGVVGALTEAGGAFAKVAGTDVPPTGALLQPSIT